MLVGVPKEIKTHEYRVGLVPSSVREFIHHGHQVIVETQAGAGIGFGEINDKTVSTSVSGVGGFREEMFVGAVGGGAEYFVAENLALGFEVKYVYPLNPDIQISGRDADLSLDPILVSAGLRLFFPK